MCRSTEAKTCRGERSAEGWWNTSTVCSALGMKMGSGARKLSTESTDGKQRRCVVCFVSKKKKIKPGLTITQELAGLLGKYGKDEFPIFCLR